MRSRQSRQLASFDPVVSNDEEGPLARGSYLFEIWCAFANLSRLPRFARVFETVTRIIHNPNDRGAMSGT